MARSASRGDLFITVGGDVAPLRTSMRAGQSVLNEFGLAAIDVQVEVEKAFSKLAQNAPAEAKKLEQSYTRTFAEIRKNAQAVLNAPSGQAAIQIIDVAGARQAAVAAEAEAVALRQVANAAIAADKAAGGTNAGVRLLALSSEAAAMEAAQHATALRGQAGALELVHAKLVGTSAATAANDRVYQRHATTIQAQRAGFQQLGFQLNDVAVQYAQGTRPAIIFAQQISQITQAVQLMAGGTSKMAGFLMGGWGIALTLAVTVLAPFVAKLFEGTDAAKKYTDETDLLAAALRGETIATDALIVSLQKLNEQELKSLQNETSLIELRYRLAKATLAAAEANKTKLQTELAVAKAARDAAVEQQGRSVGRGLEGAAGEVARTQAAVDRIQSAIDAQTTVIGQATAQLSTEMVRFARNASTEVGKVNIAFDKRQAALEAQFLGTPTTSIDKRGNKLTTLHGGSLNDPTLSDAKRQQLLSELTKKEHDLNVERQKAIVTAQKLDQAEQGRAKADTANRQSGRQVDFAQATAIAKAAGLQVNSGFRSAAAQARLFNDPLVNRPGNPVAPPGASAHNGANGRWAIDIQITDGVTPAKIRRVFADQGVSLTKVLREKGHFHIEGSRSEAAAADKEAETAAAKATRQQNDFEEQRARLNDQLLQAVGETATGYQAQSAAAQDQIHADHDRAALAIQNNLEEGKYGEATSAVAIARAAELQLINDGLETQKLVNNGLRGYSHWLGQQDAQREQTTQFRVDELQYQESIARTVGQHRDLQLEILDLIYEEKKRHLDYLKAQAELTGNTEEAARIQADINQLPRQKAREQESARRDNQSPFDRYKSELPQSLDEVNQKLEEIAVTGLNQLEDDLASATVKALGLKGALGDIASQLIKLGLQILASYASGGNPLGGLFGGPRAGGGAVNDNQFYLVGEHGPELFAPGVSGRIIPNHILAAASMPRIPRGVYGRPGSDGAWRRGGGAPVVQNFNFPNSDFDSFRRNERQLARDSRRRMDRA
jgi:hypothetical protein